MNVTFSNFVFTFTVNKLNWGFVMKGFKKRAPLALWKVILIIFASFIGLAGATGLVMYLLGYFNEKNVDPQDMAFTQVVDGDGYADNIGGDNWYFLSDDSYLTISCTTEDVTETKVTLSLRNGINRNGMLTDGVIIIPAEVELNKPFKVELVRRNNLSVGGNWIVGSASGYSYITAKSQNIMLPTKSAFIAVDTPVFEMHLAIGNGVSAAADSVQNVVVGSTFSVDAIFTPENSKYLFNNKSTSKKVFYQVLGSDGVNYITYKENQDGSYTFYADQVSGDKFSVVNAYAFSNSYFEKLYFVQHPDATTDEIVAFLQSEANKTTDDKMAVSATVNIKVLDIEVKDVIVESNGQLAEVYVDKYFTLSTNSAETPNDMSLAVSIFDSGNKPAQVLLGRMGIKIPKGKANFNIRGGRVMKVTTDANGKKKVEEENFDPDFNYAGAVEGVEYYVMPRTGSDIDYNNFYWSLSAEQVFNSFRLDINFFHKDEGGLWQPFFEDGAEKYINVLVKDSDNSVSLTTESLDLVINYDNDGAPIPTELSLSSELGANNVYTKVVYFLYDNTRDGSVDVRDIFTNCNAGVNYSKDYKGQNINISGISPKETYTLYELLDNKITASKSYSGSVVVIAALVRTDADKNVIFDEDGNYQLVAFSGARVVNVDSTLSISKMTPTFSFVEQVMQNPSNNQFYLPAINRNEDGSVKDMLSFTLKLSSEDIEKDVDKLMAAYGSALKIVCCDRDGNEYQNQYVALTGFGEDVEQRTANMAVFTGTLSIQEDFFSAGRNAVDQGRAISFKLVYNDGKETREKLVGMDEPITDGAVDFFYVYYQQPKQLKANYDSRTDISVSEKIEVKIASTGLTINWDKVNLTAASYTDTIAQLNDLLTFTILDQFGQEISPINGVYSVQFNEVRRDSNYVLSFEETNGVPTKIADFASTDGKEVDTNLVVYVVDRKNGNSRVSTVNADGTLSATEMKSDEIKFLVSTEGLSEIKYDSTDVVGNTDDGRFVSGSTVTKEVTVSKTVVADDTITLSDLFRIYTTGTDAANTDYQIVFDGTWLQNFQGNNGISLKKMLQINNEGSDVAQESITAYQNTPISTLRINAPFGVETTLTFRINSTNNLYSVTLKLVLSSDVEISRSFENYQSRYSDYLTRATTGAVSVFADEIYDLDEYLTFNSDQFSWSDAYTGKAIDLSSNVNGVFYENQGIASLNTDGSRVRLVISSVRQYTSIQITLYYGVRSEYAFNTQIALYVNPNILFEEKVDSLEASPLLDLTEIRSENIDNFYAVYKATSYIAGVKEPATLNINGTTTLSAQTLIYENKSADGFIAIENGGAFAFVAGKDIDVLHSYKQEFSVYSASDALIDAVKVKLDKDGQTEIVTYTSTNHVSVGFDVCYNKAGVDKLVEDVFPGSTVISYEGELRLLLLAGETYTVADGFSIEQVTGSYVTKNARGTELNARIPTFVDHNNTVSVYSTVSDGKSTLQINITLGVSVSNVGSEFVYYTNENKEFNKFGDVDFDKLISSDPTTLEKSGVYEALVAGKNYKVLNEISSDYSLTEDETVVEGKTYYQCQTDETNLKVYKVVENPTDDNIENYYEKNEVTAGFYYNNLLITNNGGKRDVSVEIVTTGVEGYVDGLASYADGILKINSVEKDVEAFIVLKFTLKTIGSNITSYSWHYRIKVVPNFEIGKVYYPYNESDDEVFGEYLNINSEYYNSENLTYTVDLAERFTSANSSRYSGFRFDDIKWTEMPAGVIAENYRLKSVDSGITNVSFNGTKLLLTYKNASNVGLAETIVIEKYWTVDGVEAIGSAMEYTIKLEQSHTYTTALYIGEVKTANKVGPDNQVSYERAIVAGSGEQVFIPVVRIHDGEIAGGTDISVSFGTYIKGNVLDLMDALQFKNIWIAEGTEVEYKLETSETARAGEITGTVILEENKFLVSGEDWSYADVEETQITVHTGEENQTFEIADGRVWFEMEIEIDEVLTSVQAGVKLEDLIVDFLAKGKQEYYTTSDNNRVASKTYYTLADGNFEAVAFEDGAGFEENTTYYEKYRTAYDTVTLNPKANISKNSTFEMGVYTNEGVVFKLKLNAESYFKWTTGSDEVESGNHYTFEDFISSISSKDESREISEISMTLKNGDTNYRENEYYVTADSERVSSKDYYVKNQNGEYEKVESAADAEFENGTIYYEKYDLTISDVVVLSGKIEKGEDELDLTAIKLEIAPLVSDITAVFDITIKSTDGSYYTFSIEVLVKGTFEEEPTDENRKRRVQDESWRYGKIPFDVAIVYGNGEVKTTIKPVDGESSFTGAPLASTENTSYEFVAGEEYTVKYGLDDTAQNPTVTIVHDNVESETQGIELELNVIGRFNGRRISEFKVKYRYSVAKNVIVASNYPVPNGDEENASETEYISAMDITADTEEGQRVSADYEDFFNTSATFAPFEKDKDGNVITDAEGNAQYKHRIEAVAAKRESDRSYSKLDAQTDAERTKVWDISISEISNLKVLYGDNYGTSANSVGDIATNLVGGKINFRFVLLNTGSNGTVTFAVRVNKVLTYYSVTVVSIPIVRVMTNVPNYIEGKEIVFAEDLATSEEQTLFTENRVLNFTFRNSVVTGQTYYVRLTNRKNTAENKIVPITVTNLGFATNVDLGKSYKDFDYNATFTTLTAAQNGDDNYKVADDSSIFLSAPKLTSRIVVEYLDGSVVKLDGESNYIKVGKKSETDGETVFEKADEIILETKDYHNETSFEIAVNVGKEIIKTTAIYNIYLDIEFDVSDNADSATSYQTKTINAGQELSLLDSIDFGIINSRTGNKYSNKGGDKTDSFLTSGGTVELQIYGFNDLQIVENPDDSLQNAAYQIHTELMSKPETSTGIIYKTGLNPRARLDDDNKYTSDGNFQLNEDTGSIDYNYLTYSDVVENGKKVDFSIRARGASNDGNYVMLRITYSVSFGNSNNEPIVVSHNLMLKVLPNSSVSFLTRYGSQATTASVNEMIDDQNWATNSSSVFEINNDDSKFYNEFYLWKKDDVSASAIQAYLYGNNDRTRNNADLFSFEYSDSQDNTDYNNFFWVDADEENALKSGVSLKNDQGVYVSIRELKLGSRNFYITATDRFGFKVKFYFRLKATENPEIAEMSVDTLTEGQAVVIGAQYQTVNPSIVSVTTADNNTERRQLLGTFIYKYKGGSLNGDEYANVIGNIPHQYLSKLYLSAQTSTMFGTITKEYNSLSNTISIWNNDAGNWKLVNGDAGFIEIPNPNYNPQGSGSDKEPTIKEYVTQQTLLNSTISIYGVFRFSEFKNDGTVFQTYSNLVYKDAANNPNAAEDAETPYLDEEIKQEYNITGGYEIPSLSTAENELNEDKARVSLRGISAYGFRATGKDLSIDALNTDAAREKFVSKVNDMKVIDVEYFLNVDGIKKSLGKSVRSKKTVEAFGSDSSVGTEDGVSLVTSGDYVFYKKEEAQNEYRNIAGVGYEKDKYDFIVPVIDPLYFEKYGENGKTLVVTMRITLQEGTGTTCNYCNLETNVKLSRLASEPEFSAMNIKDNESITFSSTTRTVYNDTLEVVLEPNETVKFAISLAPLYETPSSGIVEVSNPNSEFAVTEYVGITKSLIRDTKFSDITDDYQEMIEKFKTGHQPFYITVVEHSVNGTESDAPVNFVYNGSQIKEGTLCRYDEVKDSVYEVNKDYYYYIRYSPVHSYRPATNLFNKLTVSGNIQGLTYYELVEGKFVLKQAPIIGETECYVKGYSFYIQTSDTEIVAGKTYYTQETQNDVTYYAAVSAPSADSIESYYEEQNLYEKVDSLSYESQRIVEYKSNIRLHINDVSELNGNSKGETLYFLFAGANTLSSEYCENFTNSGKVYQMSKTFSVYPQFESADSEYTDPSGNIEFKVDEYLKVENADSGEYYYIIPRAVWGNYLTLRNYQNLGLTSEYKLSAQAQVAQGYKFMFEINKEVEGGAGGAFIDEEGNIITDKNFNLQESTITVNVFMKVSGQNGCYDVATKELPLCTFRMMLNANNFTDDNLVDESALSSYGLFIYGGRFSGDSSANSGVLAIPYENSKVYAPTSQKDSVWISEIEESNILKTKDFAVEVGKTIDLAELLGDMAFDEYKMHNLTYHIVEDKIGDNSSILHYNNIGSYKIETAGTHTLTVLYTFRYNLSGNMNYGKVTFDVMAYNVLDRTEKVVMVNASTKNEDDTITASTYELGEGDWYELGEKGEVTSIEKVTVGEGENEREISLYTVPVETGIYTKSFVSKDSNGNTRVFSYTFYVVSAGDMLQKQVVLNQDAAFSLSRLFPTTGYRFYKVRGNFIHGADNVVINEVTVENNFTNRADTYTEANYIVRDPNGVYSKLNVTYKFTTQASPKEVGIFIEQGQSFKGAVSEQVTKDLKETLKNQTFEVVDVQIIGEGNLLSKEDETASENVDEFQITKDYLVTYTVGEDTRYLKYKVSFFTYKTSSNITIKTEANNRYSLSSANTSVINALGLTDVVSVDSVAYYGLNGTRLEQPEQGVISLATLDSGNISEKFLVRVEYTKTEMVDGEEQNVRYTEFHLVNITFTNA